MTIDTQSRENRPLTSAGSTVFEHLDRLVQNQPQLAIAEGRRLLDEHPDPVVRMDVWATIGRALYELGDMPRAKQAMRKALQDGAALAGDDSLRAVRISAAVVFAEAGELRAALHQLAQAEDSASGAELGRIHSQRAFVLAHAGRLVEARAQAVLSERELIAGHDRLALLRLLVNRSMIDLQLGALHDAEAALVRAGRLAEQLDQAVAAALIVGNLGVLHARAGRTMPALALFARAREMYTAVGSPLRTMAILEADRAEALLRAGMHDDAVAAAHVAVAHAAASGNLVSRGDAELLLARAHLAAGKLGAAQRTAAGAATLLRAGHRRGIALQARAIGLQAALGAATGDREATTLFERSRALGRRLEAEGWAEISDDLRCARLRVASRLGRLDDVADDFTVLRRSIRSPQPAVALRAWYADCLARRHADDDVGAMRSARSGMRALDRFRRSTADLQIRAGLSAIGDDLARLAVHIATTSGSASATFAWAERTRSHAYAAPADAGGRQVPTLTEIRRQLGDRTLVEYVVDDGHVHAVVVRGSRSRLVDLGPANEIWRAVDQLTAWMDRAMVPTDTTHPGVVIHVAARLGRLLVEPLGLPRSESLVIIPVDRLHAVPWSALPQLSGSTTSIHVSARLWLRSDRRADPPGGAALESFGLIVGPDVLGAAIERRAARSLQPNVMVRSGGQATPAALRTMLGRHDVVQIAAHGVFHAERPMQSTLRLHGGEMAIYDLDGVDVHSRVVILSSCEAGVHRVNAGGEVLGLVAILLDRGAATVLAPIHTVPDLACAEFVADVQRIWSTGLTVAEALADVRRRWLERSSIGHWATAAAFTCFGSGRSRFSP